MDCKRMKVISIILIIIAIILIIIPFITKKPNNKKLSTKETMTKINEIVISNDQSIEKLRELTGLTDINNEFIMTGKDSYMRQKPSSEIIKNNNLEEYESLQDKYATILEEEINSNFEIKSINKLQEENGQIIYSSVAKTFYQSIYLFDLKKLETTISQKLNKEDEISKYKIKVISMEILNEHIKDYINDNEYTGINLYVYEDEDLMKNSLLSYISMLRGTNYHGEKSSKLDNTREERINNYIEENKDKINELR